jgi:dephospho-CoA kinase
VHGINTRGKGSPQAVDIEVNRKKLIEECVKKTKASKRKEKKTMQAVATHTEEVINDASKNNVAASVLLKSCCERLTKRTNVVKTKLKKRMKPLQNKYTQLEEGLALASQSGEAMGKENEEMTNNMIQQAVVIANLTKKVRKVKAKKKSMKTANTALESKSDADEIRAENEALKVENSNLKEQVHAKNERI